MAQVMNSRIPKHAAVFALAALSCGSGHGETVCSPPNEAELLYVQRDNIEATAVDAPVLSTTESVFRARLWRMGDEQHRRELRLYHDYRAYDLTAIGVDDHRSGRLVGAKTHTPQANGHVHRLGVGYRFGTPRWEWILAPVLAASSNVGRQPRVINGEMVAWHAAIRRRYIYSPTATAFFGVCRDDRFGAPRLNPMVGVHWQVKERLMLTLAWPDSRMALRLSKRWQLWAEARPSGGHWHVYDDALATRSRFSYRGWRVDFGVAIKAGEHRLAAAVGRETRRSLRLALTNGDEVDIEAPDARRLSVRWQWLR